MAMKPNCPLGFRPTRAPTVGGVSGAGDLVFGGPGPPFVECCLCGAVLRLPPWEFAVEPWLRSLTVAWSAWWSLVPSGCALSFSRVPMNPFSRGLVPALPRLEEALDRELFAAGCCSVVWLGLPVVGPPFSRVPFKPFARGAGTSSSRPAAPAGAPLVVGEPARAETRSVVVRSEEVLPGSWCGTACAVRARLGALVGARRRRGAPRRCGGPGRVVDRFSGVAGRLGDMESRPRRRSPRLWWVGGGQCSVFGRLRQVRGGSVDALLRGDGHRVSTAIGGVCGDMSSRQGSTCRAMVTTGGLRRAVLGSSHLNRLSAAACVRCCLPCF